MPAESISMRKLKEILRLKYQAKLSHRKIGTSLSISPGTVSTYINRAKLMGKMQVKSLAGLIKNVITAGWTAGNP